MSTTDTFSTKGNHGSHVHMLVEEEEEERKKTKDEEGRVKAIYSRNVKKRWKGT